MKMRTTTMHQRFSHTAISIPVTDNDGVKEQHREGAVAVSAFLVACIVLAIWGFISPANAHAAERNGKTDDRTTVEWVRTHGTIARFFGDMLYLHHTCVREQPQGLQVCMDTGRAAKVASTR